jgi:MFS family permease
MSQSLDLKEVEQRVLQSVYQDGLMEIFLGGFLLMFGVLFAIRSRLASFSVLLIFLLNPLLERAKKRYIYPRIGYVKLRPEKQADTKGIVIVVGVLTAILLGALGVFVLAMGRERGLPLWLNHFFPAFAGFMLAIGPFWWGQTFGVRRGYVLAALFLLSGILIPVLGMATGYEAVALECMLVGMVSLISGTVLFTRFLRRYPPEEMPDVAG